MAFIRSEIETKLQQAEQLLHAKDSALALAEKSVSALQQAVHDKGERICDRPVDGVISEAGKRSAELSKKLEELARERTEVQCQLLWIQQEKRRLRDEATASGVDSDGKIVARQTDLESKVAGLQRDNERLANELRLATEEGKIAKGKLEVAEGQAEFLRQSARTAYETGEKTAKLLDDVTASLHESQHAASELRKQLESAQSTLEATQDSYDALRNSEKLRVEQLFTEKAATLRQLRETADRLRQTQESQTAAEVVIERLKGELSSKSTECEKSLHILQGKLDYRVDAEYDSRLATLNRAELKTQLETKDHELSKANTELQRYHDKETAMRELVEEKYRVQMYVLALISHTRIEQGNAWTWNRCMTDTRPSSVSTI